MSIKEDYFFKKITRVASEFMILSILAEKGISHPYELHEIVQNQVLKKYKERFENLNTFIQTCEKIVDFYKSSEKAKTLNIEEITKDLSSPLLKYLSKIFIQKVENNKDIILDLERLKKEGAKILAHRGSGLKVWDHVPSIYQVVSELENRELIKEKGTTTIKGRTRKLYEITAKGREEALRMIIVFGDLHQVLIPKALLFQENFSVLFQTHLNSAMQVLGKLFPDKSILNLVRELEASSPIFEGAFDGLFPIIDDDLLLFSLLLEDYFAQDNIRIDGLSSEQQALFKYLLVKRFKKYRDKLDLAILNLQ